ncbi:ACT domain-containing protein [Candidatus Bipolaricaulota bacterium]|nr:ACT domain-containing protein [Candidatus Bipolaricaulota bacterium]
MVKGTSRGQIMIDAQLQQEIVLRSEDRVGVLAEIARVLSEMGINLLAVRLRSIEGEAIVHLLTTSQSYACEALRDAGFELSQRDVVMLELPHHLGFLRRVSEALARKDISIDDLHISVPEEGKVGVVVLTCSNNAHAIQILRGH